MGFIIFNFIKSIFKLTIKLSLYLAVFATFIVLIPNLPPYAKFSSIEVAPTQDRVGPLAPNNALNNAQKLYKGKLEGPEAFQVANGELYTSLATGEVVKISPGGHITFVTKLGQPCTGLSKAHICGRPLGFEIDETAQTIYIADAYYGIWKVDLKTDKKQLLVSPRVEINKRAPKVFNSLALGKNGDLYWTDSTSDFHLHDGMISVLTDPSGRVFHYNAAKNQSTVLVDDLWFANGLVVSPNNDFLVIVETFKMRLLKHYLAGPKKGTTEVFIDGLPGTPDNARVLPDGSGILVGLYTVFDQESPILLRSLAATPLVRKFLARLLCLIEIPFAYLNSIYPHVILEDIVYHIGHFKSVSGTFPNQPGVLIADWNGNIVAMYENTDGSLIHISDAIVFNDKLYTGSPHGQDFIGAVPAPPLLKRAFQSAKKRVDTKPQQTKPVEQAKAIPVEQKPKVEPKPKIEEKPKVQQKAKIEERPKVQEPKVEQKKVETKPKVEEKQGAPKADKPVETVKPKVQTTTSPSPKPTPPTRPTTAQPIKNTQQTPEQPKITTPKPEVKTTSQPKPSTTTPSPTETPKKAEEPKKTQKPVKQETPKSTQAKTKEQIPIKEEIPLDTAKPTKETLKVIKKGGVPTEIPVPNQ